MKKGRNLKKRFLLRSFDSLSIKMCMKTNIENGNVRKKKDWNLSSFLSLSLSTWRGRVDTRRLDLIIEGVEEKRTFGSLFPQGTQNKERERETVTTACVDGKRIRGREIHVCISLSKVAVLLT